MFKKLFGKKDYENPDIVEEESNVCEISLEPKFDNSEITKDTMIGDIVEKYPETVETLLSYGVHCIGCHVSPFESLEMGFKGHGMDDSQVEDAVIKLNEVVKNSKNNLSNEIYLTKNAAEKIKNLTKKGGLRVYVEKGGCSGYTYEMEIVESKKKDDLEFEDKGAKVFIDKESFDKLKGSYIDFLDSLQGAGFKVKNPNASQTCGCGESFG